MVARINSGKSIAKALNYNEQKLKQGQAECLQAFNFMKDVDKLNFYDKLRHFERLTSLNARTTENTVHISLNFHPSEKLSNAKLEEIAKNYMQKIGFGNQPCLVYRHYDAGHPHIHIVSTNIQSDGKGISLHNLGRNQSEKARKEIETEFGLVKAESHKQTESLKLQQVNAQKLSYGKTETKRALSNVLSMVISQYKFTSMAELNAVLRLYNVLADRGQEGTRLYNYRGLHYRVLDDNGNKVGAPIKASAFYFKPTLENLEKKFAENESLRLQHKQRLKASIDWSLAKRSPSLPEFMKALEKEKISTVLRQNKEGLLYGITFVDHQTKCVFNGSDLGKQYSAAAIEERCAQRNILVQKQSEVLRQKQDIMVGQGMGDKFLQASEFSAENPRKEQIPKLLDELITPVQTNDYLPYQLKKSKRKRKGQSQSKYL